MIVCNHIVALPFYVWRSRWYRKSLAVHSINRCVKLVVGKIRRDYNGRKCCMDYGEYKMDIETITKDDKRWNSLSDYAKACSWGAGKFFAKWMEEHEFEPWEKVIAAFDGTRVAGYCTLSKKDCIPEVPYTPYIGFVFVDEAYRGNRLSERMIQYALQEAKKLGFEQVYLVSDHVNLYEKYGFIRIDQKPAPWEHNTMESIFMHTT